MPCKKLSLDEAFKVLERCALAGDRCPIAGTKGLESVLTSALARAGRIRIDVYPHNYRVVTIAAGPNAGRATALPPNPNWRPYLTIQREA